MSRDELIKEIEEKVLMGKEFGDVPMAFPYSANWICFGARIADFILRRERAMAEKILSRISNGSLISAINFLDAIIKEASDGKN